MTVPQSIESTRDLPRELRRKVRHLYHTGALSKGEILKRVPGLTSQQLNEILSEVDDLEDFRMDKFSKMVRDLYSLSDRIIKSVNETDLEVASVSARASLLRHSADLMKRLYDLQLIQLQQSDDMALARLLALGRDEAREQLIERFRGLFHILFGGMDPEEVAQQLGLMNLKKAVKQGDSDDSSPKLKVLDGSAGATGTDGSDGGAGSISASGTGAFRGVKKGKPS